MLIKILLSAFDISAKLYPLQEQESSSLQRGAHSVTCNYGIYCRVKRCLGCTCRPNAHRLFPRRESRSPRPLPKEPGPAQAHRGRAGTQDSWGGAGSLALRRCEPPPRPSGPPTASAPAHPERGGLLEVSVKNGFFNEKLERPEPRWVRSPAGCWLQAGSHPFL